MKRLGNMALYWATIYVIAAEDCFSRTGPRPANVAQAEALHKRLWPAS